MKNTAIHSSISMLKQMSGLTSNDAYAAGMQYCIAELESRVEEEKQNIIDAFTAGQKEIIKTVTEAFSFSEIDKFENYEDCEDAESYFSKTFNKIQ